MAEGVIYNGLPMPLYEYECSSCGHRFEQIRKFSDPPVLVCPKCGGAVDKLMSSPAVQFKGTGWYVTDYARKDSKDSKETKDSKGKDAAEATKDSKDTKEKESTDTAKDTKESKDTAKDTRDTKSESTPKNTKGTKPDA
jgi:putative FmdB family regulatory protein